MSAPSDKGRTGREICEAYVKFKGLKMTGAQFWCASPSGDLFHVYEAYQEMLDAGYEIPRLSDSAAPQAKGGG